MPDPSKPVVAGTGGRLRPVITLLFLCGAALTFEASASTVLPDVTGRSGPPLLAALGNLLAGLRFAWTLFPGREPLISRYSRFDAAGLPDADGRYTRRLTLVWALLLIGFALAFLLAALGLLPVAPLARLHPTLVAALFLGEHAVRSRCFPELGRVTPLRTIRAICLSYRQVVHAP